MKSSPYIKEKGLSVREYIKYKVAEIRARREKKQLEVNKILSKKRK